MSLAKQSGKNGRTEKSSSKQIEKNSKKEQEKK